MTKTKERSDLEMLEENIRNDIFIMLCMYVLITMLLRVDKFFASL